MPLPAFAQAPAPAPAQAPTQPNARTLALAAGWKALFLCSGTFLAGMAEADITANDLEGGYPELQPHIAGLAQRIDRSQRLVEVAFDTNLPPRIARYARGRGCALLPTGAAADTVMKPPELIGGP
ncbi:MAG: serine hydrolase domain-containing protein, partial [Sandaracinobacteroides sp.]